MCPDLGAPASRRPVSDTTPAGRQRSQNYIRRFISPTPATGARLSAGRFQNDSFASPSVEAV